MARDPEDPIETIQREVERMFRDLVYHRHPSTHFSELAFRPAADLVVSRRAARVLLELAGVPRESVRVTLRGRTLEVSGRRNPPQEPGDAHYHRAEIYFGEFKRTIDLPWDADENTVEARYKNGMLEIHLKPVQTPTPTDIPLEQKQSR
jgi:HSP20 family protein